MDIMLDKKGDLDISPEGDIILGDSVAQKILIRLRWFEGEWRWDRERGLPYLDSLLVKNPDTDSFESAVREQIFQVEEVTGIKEVSAALDGRTRRANIRFIAVTDLETIKREVEMDALVRGDRKRMCLKTLRHDPERDSRRPNGRLWRQHPAVGAVLFGSPCDHVRRADR